MRKLILWTADKSRAPFPQRTAWRARSLAHSLTDGRSHHKADLHDNRRRRRPVLLPNLLDGELVIWHGFHRSHEEGLARQTAARAAPLAAKKRP